VFREESIPPGAEAATAPIEIAELPAVPPPDAVRAAFVSKERERLKVATGSRQLPADEDLNPPRSDPLERFGELVTDRSFRVTGDPTELADRVRDRPPLACAPGEIVCELLVDGALATAGVLADARKYEGFHEAPRYGF
jgi:hypothetical protein